MDVRMPVMDGLEATRHIRGMTREDARRIPIFALSANAFADDIQRSLQCGMNTHLTSLWIWIPFARHCTTGWNMIKETGRDVAVLLRQCLRHPEWD